MTTFQIWILVIFGVMGAAMVLVLYQLWKTLKAVERIFSVEVPKVALEIQQAITDARRTIQEATHLVSSLKDNFGHMNSTFAHLSESVFRVAEMFQAPWAKVLGYVSEAFQFVKQFKSSRSSTRPKEKSSR